MKNKFYEQRIASAKKHRSERREDMYIPHCYKEPREYSWWDDISFNYGSQRVCVTWVHPRMKYIDRVDDAAYAAAREAVPSYSTDNWFNQKGITHYRKVGKSRKKACSVEMPHEWGAEGFFQKWREIKEQMLKESHEVIYPSFKVVQWGHSRNVDICFPLEVTSEEDCWILRKIVVSILDGRNTVDSLVPGYFYNRHMWNEEKHEGYF